MLGGMSCCTCVRCETVSSAGTSKPRACPTGGPVTATAVAKVRWRTGNQRSEMMAQLMLAQAAVTPLANLVAEPLEPRKASF